MWSLFIFSFLLGLTLADVSAVLHGNGTHGGHPGGLNLTSGCGYRQFFNNQWDQSGINEWLARELRTFNADSNDDQFFVKDYMRLKYANMTTPQMGDCTAATGCLVISRCDDITWDNKTEAEFAYNLFISFSNFARTVGDLHRDLDDMGIQFSLGVTSLVEAFTFADEIDEFEDHMKFRKPMDKKSMFYLASLIGSGMSLLKEMKPKFEPAQQGSMDGEGGGFGGGFGGGGGVPAEVPPVPARLVRRQEGGPSLPPTGKMTMNLLPIPQIISFVFSIFLYEQTRDPKDVPADSNTDKELVATREITKFLADDYENSRNVTRNITQTLVQGWSLKDIGGPSIDISNFLAHGLYANMTGRGSNALQSRLETFKYASLINELWSTERIWIMTVDLDNQNCADHKTGPEITKVCLKEVPNKVFYVYALPKFFEADGVRISDIYAPPGWDLLKDGTYHGVYPEAIVRSSYHYWTQFGNSRDPSNIDRFAMNLNSTDPMLQRSLEDVGIFNLPICYNPGGELISSIATKAGRRYPCYCSPPNKDNSVEEITRVYAEFLEASNLRFSYDLNDACFARKKKKLKKDGQHCAYLSTSTTLDQYYKNSDPKGFSINEKACFNDQDHNNKIDKLWDKWQQHRGKKGLQCLPMAAWSNNCQIGPELKGAQNQVGKEYKAPSLKDRGYGLDHKKD